MLLMLNILTEHSTKVGDCLVWQGKTRSNGRYGYFHCRETHKTLSVHRIACEIKNGPPKQGEIARHSCHNTKCVNPDHLAWGTTKDNWKDSEAKQRSNFGITIAHNWNKSGLSNPNSKYSNDIFIKCRELRKTGMGYEKIRKAVGLKSKGHVRQICLAK